jgi:acid stress chaperone HdeA
MTVRRIGTAVVVALMASSTLALAQTSAPKQPLSKLTCEQFLAYDATVQPKVVYWAAAYGKGGKPEAAVLDVEATEKVIPVIIEKCKAAPKDSFLKTMKSESAKSMKK